MSCSDQDMFRSPALGRGVHGAVADDDDDDDDALGGPAERVAAAAALAEVVSMAFGMVCCSVALCGDAFVEGSEKSLVDVPGS